MVIRIMNFIIKNKNLIFITCIYFTRISIPNAVIILHITFLFKENNYSQLVTKFAQ